MVLAPLVRGRKGQHHGGLPGDPPLGPDPRPGRRRDHRGHRRTARSWPRPRPITIEAVVDRLVIREGIRPRLAESINLASSSPRASSSSRPRPHGGWEDQVLSVHLACPNCGTGLQSPEPRSFSFNSPHGACPTCEGLGVVATCRKPTRSRVPCPACDGTRLRPEARAVKIAGQSIDEVSALPITEPERVLRRADASTRPRSRSPGRSSGEIASRLRFLAEVGLGLPDPGTRLRHAFRRRASACAAGDAAWRGAGRRLLRPGRADGRAASPRHRSAHRQPAKASGRGQQRDRRRAR